MNILRAVRRVTAVAMLGCLMPPGPCTFRWIFLGFRLYLVFCMQSVSTV